MHCIYFPSKRFLCIVYARTLFISGILTSTKNQMTVQNPIFKMSFVEIRLPVYALARRLLPQVIHMYLQSLYTHNGTDFRRVSSTHQK